MVFQIIFCLFITFLLSWGDYKLESIKTIRSFFDIWLRFISLYILGYIIGFFFIVILAKLWLLI